MVSLADLQVSPIAEAFPPFELDRAIPEYGANLPYLTDLACRNEGLQNPDTAEYQAAHTRLYYRIYRRLKRLAADGILELTKMDGLVFARPRDESFYLVRQEQNSKTPDDPAKRPNREQCEKILEESGDVDPKAGINPLYKLPARSKPQRIEAIKSYLTIRDPSLFVRPDPDTLNPDLVTALAPSENQFGSYLEEVEDQVIILKKGNPNAPGRNYLMFPYTVRFNDAHKKVRNLKTYENAIDNSVQMFEDGVFLTLTTDPLLWMGPAGMEFTRTIKNQEGEVLARYYAKAKGKTLWHANRHESEAWRKYYEKLVHRFGWRIPYIRVVEFMENGLIHLHVLFFGITWLDDFRKVAEDWGVTYGQGFNCQICRVKRRGGRWDWASKKDVPQDADGKKPDDYLKKYLKKALFNTDGYSPYWVCNKRFFTMSQSLRYQEIAEAVKAKLERKSAGIYEFLGAVRSDLVSDAIARDAGQKQSEPVEPLPINQKPKTWRSEIHPDMVPFGRHRRRDRPPDPPDPPDDAPDDAPIAVKIESEGCINEKTGKPWSLADFM